MNKISNVVVLNMTPHDIILLDGENNVIKTFSPSGKSIRLAEKTEKVEMNNFDFPVTKTTFGSADLPEVKAGTFYIVSGLVKSAFPERTDFMVPAESVRDEKGRIIGCRSFGI